MELSKPLLNEHEVLSLARHYGKRKYPVLTTLMWIVQNVLSRGNFTAFPQLEAALQEVDTGEGGFLSRSKIRFICHSVDLPLADQLIDGVMMK